MEQRLLPINSNFVILEHSSGWCDEDEDEMLMLLKIKSQSILDWKFIAQVPIIIVKGRRDDESTLSSAHLTK